MRCLKGNQLLLPEVHTAQTFWTRLRGLLGRTQIAPGEGLLIRPCNSVHTLGMKFPIGVVFLSRSGEVRHLIAMMPPGKLSPLIRGADQVLELHPDTLAQAELKIGDTLTFAAE